MNTPIANVGIRGSVTQLNRKQRGTGTKIILRKRGVKWHWCLQDSLYSTLHQCAKPLSTQKEAYAQAQAARDRYRDQYAKD